MTPDSARPTTSGKGTVHPHRHHSRVPRSLLRAGGAVSGCVAGRPTGRCAPTRGPAAAIRSRCRERGSASVWTLAVGAAVVAVAVFGAAVGSAVIARHRAQAAADLGALAGAAHVVQGRAVACRHAARIIVRNEARLVSCRVTGLEVVVTAEVEAPGVGAHLRPAQGRARAGPVWTPLDGTYGGGEA